jgi:hypothetical protein
MRFRVVSWKPARRHISLDRLALEPVYSHSGFSARLIVPAMHAADRRSLNSKPSFDTRVTYSLTFSELIAAELVITSDTKCMYKVWESGLGKDKIVPGLVRRTFREHESAPSRVDRLRYLAGQHSPNTHLTPISTFTNISKGPDVSFFYTLPGKS